MPAYTVNLTSWSGGTGSGSWASPGNAQTADGNYAVANSLLAGGNTTYLTGTSPTSISPGGNEIISSVVATVTRRAGNTDTVIDEHVYLVKGGLNQTAIDKALGAAWPQTETAQAYTWSSSDLASLGVTLVTVQQSNFGVALMALETSNAQPEVDAIVLTVNTSYTAVPGGNFVLPPYGLRG